MPDHQETLLTYLTEHRKATIQELQNETGLDHSTVRSLVDRLVKHDLATVTESRQQRLELTPKGEQALENGVPEKQLLTNIEDSPQPIGELQKKIDAFNIALGEGKKNNWLTLDKEDGTTVVAITENGKEQLEEGFPTEEALNAVRENGKSQEDDILKQRGLVEKQEKTTTTIRLDTDKTVDQITQLLGTASDRITKITSEVLRSKKWKSTDIDTYDVSKPVKIRRPGKRHPYRRYLDEVRQKLMAMGFKEAKTDLVEMEFWNFDVLFQAQDHPAREIHDKFELKDPAHGDLEHDTIVERVKKTHEEGWELPSTGWNYEWSKEKASRLMLRSQTTATTIQYLAKGQPSPSKVFAIDRNFRYDEIDKTHFVEFYQAEGIVKAKDLSLKNLFGYLEVFAKEIAGAEDIRFRPGYFPFTEPSVELDAYHPDLGWIELGGAGLFRPEVRKPLGVDDPVIAWGMGIDRLAMFKLEKDDIRELVFPQDLDYLRKSPALVF